MHFVGFKPKWDEVIELSDEGWRRIKEIGAFSNAHGWAKYNQAYRERVQYESSDLKDLVAQIKRKQIAAALAAQAQKDGVATVKQSGLIRVAQGITSMEELYRVI